MTDIFKTLHNDIIKIAKSKETDFLPLIKSVYGDTPDAVLKGAVFASHIYKEGGKEREKILLECGGELRAKKSPKHIKKFNQMFPKSGGYSIIGRRYPHIKMPLKRMYSVWVKGNKIRGENPNIYRRDSRGNKIRYASYGKQTNLGWEIDHIIPLAKGGGDTLSNLQPLQWEENKMKFIKPKNKVTMTVIKKIYPIARDVYEERKTLNDGVDQLVEETRMSRGNASVYIRFFVKLKEGELHRDKMSANLMATSYFLKKILADDGKDGLRVALESLRKYIEYSEEKFRDYSLLGLRKIYAGFSGNL